MIACFYFLYRFISEVLLWIFNLGGQTCVFLHCRSLNKSLRHVLLFYSLFLMCQARLGSSLRELQPVSQSFKTAPENLLVWQEKEEKFKKPKTTNKQNNFLNHTPKLKNNAQSFFTSENFFFFCPALYNYYLSFT